MARKQTARNREERVFLLKSNDVFKEELIDRIAEGKNLALNQYVPRSQADYYGQLGYMSMRRGNEPTEEHKRWITEFNK